MRKYVLLTLLLLALTGCSEKKDETPAADLRLEPAAFGELQGFEADDMSPAYEAFRRGCAAIAGQKGEFLGNAKIKINRRDYLAACAAAEEITPAGFKEFVKKHFQPFRVVWQGSPEGKFTAYYEAEIKASLMPDSRYKYPVYGRPDDLVEVNLKDFAADLPARKIVGRVENGKLVPYYTRAEINRQGIDAPVILWADSDVDVYIMQIQGSAVARLPDGGRLRIAFAESNGRPFKGIGSILLSKGLLEPGQASMGSIKKWLKANPELARPNMDENQRYIFHRLGNPEGPVGALGVPLTAGRSLAVDKTFVPLGALLWLQTSTPDRQPLNRLVLAQDIGSAIKGAVRGDYFWGSGGDDVLEAAGRMNSAGQYFVLLPVSSEEDNGKENQ